jgi:dihydroxyacid dehydratase/phosphogluconate dehydratase
VKPGPLAVVSTGDMIELDVRGRRLDVELTADELRPDSTPSSRRSRDTSVARSRCTRST